MGESHLNYIRHGKGKRGDELPEELGHRETRLKKIREAKRALEARAREKAGAERGAPDQAKPKDKDQYNFTDPQSRIMPGAFRKVRDELRAYLREFPQKV